MDARLPAGKNLLRSHDCLRTIADSRATISLQGVAAYGPVAVTELVKLAAAERPLFVSIPPFVYRRRISYFYWEANRRMKMRLLPDWRQMGNFRQSESL